MDTTKNETPTINKANLVVLSYLSCNYKISLNGENIIDL